MGADHTLDYKCRAINNDDFNDDGIDDLAVCRYRDVSHKILLWMSNDKEYVQTTIPYSLDAGVPICIDYDGNSLIDLLLIESGNTVFFKNTDGIFTEEFIYESNLYQIPFIDATDIDNDNNLDILVWPYLFSYLDGTINVNTISISGEFSIYAGHFSDFDQDGDSDLFITISKKDILERDRKYLCVFENNQGEFRQYIEFNLGRDFFIFDSHWLDLDNDGKLDFTALTDEGFIIWHNEMNDTISGYEYTPSIPLSITLSNHPNPFNPSTTISYTLPAASHIRLSVYSVTGQQVAVLSDGPMSAGTHTVTFDGSGLASGIYFYRLESPETVKTGKMLLVK